MNKKKPRKAFALIMVLVLIVMLSLGVYAFTDMMTVRERETVMMGRRAQAEAAVVSGVEYLKDYLSMLPEDQAALGGHWDNPAYFNDVVVADEPGGTTRFAIISILEDPYGEPTGIRYGLEDLGAKININEVVSADRYKGDTGDGDAAANDAGGEADQGDEGGQGDQGGDEGDQGGLGGAGRQAGGNGSGPLNTGPVGGEETEQQEVADEEDPFADPQRDVLMQLPLMTEAIADAILDWIDEDSDPRPFGAEAESYSFVEPANGPISSLDELLLVVGVTPELLFGADRNHNGVIDESEQLAAATLAASAGSMARGWSAFLTVTSKDVLVQVEEPIDVNQDDLEAMYDELVAAGFDADFATYVAAYRQNGPYTPPPIPDDAPDDFELPVPEPIDGRTVDLTKDGGQKLTSVLDLIGTFVQGTFEGGQEPVVMQSPYGDDSDLAAVLPELMGSLTAGDSGGTGRVNTNACSAAVLAAIPGMEVETVQGILGGQDAGGMSGDLNYLYPTWPLAQGIVTVEQMKAMLPYVSGTGVIFRAQVVAYSEVPGQFARAEVIMDASDGSPRVVSWRDLTHLGPGFSLETLTNSQ